MSPEKVEARAKAVPGEKVGYSWRKGRQPKSSSSRSTLVPTPLSSSSSSSSSSSDSSSATLTPENQGQSQGQEDQSQGQIDVMLRIDRLEINSARGGRGRGRGRGGQGQNRREIISAVQEMEIIFPSQEQEDPVNNVDVNVNGDIRLLPARGRARPIRRLPPRPRHQ